MPERTIKFYKQENPDGTYYIITQTDLTNKEADQAIQELNAAFWFSKPCIKKYNTWEALQYNKKELIRYERKLLKLGAELRKREQLTKNLEFDPSNGPYNRICPLPFCNTLISKHGKPSAKRHLARVAYLLRKQGVTLTL